LACNEIFYDEEDLIAHDVEMHNRCATCQRFFDSPSNLLNVSLTSLSHHIFTVSYLPDYSTKRSTWRKTSNVSPVRECLFQIQQ
jgi:hypothetical protein